MTTFEQAIIEELTSSGFFPDQAQEVFDRLVANPAQASMKGRWKEDYTGYPKPVYAILLVAMRGVALDYIKEKMPQAWFRPMFDDEMAKELSI
jgi:hypothetical protein